MDSACIAGPARKQHEQQRHVHRRGSGRYCAALLALTALPLMLADAAADTLYALDAPQSVLAHAAAGAVLAPLAAPHNALQAKGRLCGNAAQPRGATLR